MSVPKLERGARPCDSGHVGSLSVRFGEATGRTPQSASQRLNGRKARLEDEAVAYLTICRQDGRFAEGQAFLHKQQEAFAGTVPERYTAALAQLAADVDAAEDPRLLDIVSRISGGTATSADLLDYAKLLMKEISVKFRLYDAVVAKRRELTA